MDERIRRARRHEKDAFVALMRENEGRLYRVAIAMLQNDEDAADAMQDTVLTCWEKIDTLRADRYFSTWLTRILINRCNDILAKRRAIVAAEGLVEAAVPESAYHEIEWNEALSALEEKHRIVLLLYYGQGFKVREIADILELNVNTVKDRLVAARRQYERIVLDRKEEAHEIG